MQVQVYLSQAGVKALAEGSPYAYYHIHCFPVDGQQGAPAGSVHLGTTEVTLPTVEAARALRRAELDALIEQERAQSTLRLEKLLEEQAAVQGGAK